MIFGFILIAIFVCVVGILILDAWVRQRHARKLAREARGDTDVEDIFRDRALTEEEVRELYDEDGANDD